MSADLNASLTAAQHQITMYDLRDLSRMTGWSNRQLRTRIDACATLLDGHRSNGRHGRILLDDYAASLLRRMYELEKDGHTVELAVDLLSQELQDPQQNGVEEASHNGEATGDLVAELRSQNEYLRKENAWLRERVETLEPLALPAPRRGPLAWVADLFRST